MTDAVATKPPIETATRDRQLDMREPCRLVSPESTASPVDVGAARSRRAKGARCRKRSDRMAFFQKSDPRDQRALENQLKATRKRADDKAVALTDAEIELTECRATVEKTALGDDRAKLKAAQQAKRAAEDDVAALSGAVATIANEIAGLESEIAKLVDERTRSETAAAIVSIARQLGEATAGFNSAISDLETALRACSPVALEAHGVVAFTMSAKTELPPAIQLVVEALNQYRNGVLSGHHRASLPQEPAPPLLKVVEAVPMKEIVALRPIRWVDAQGAVAVLGQLQRGSMPAGLADQALRSNQVALVSDPRMRGQIGLRGTQQPLAGHCEWVGAPAPDKPAPKSTAAPVMSSHFEPLPGVGKPYKVSIPRSEPVAMGQRNMEEDDHG